MSTERPPYAATFWAKKSTEQIEKALAKAEAEADAVRGKTFRAYYQRMGQEQALAQVVLVRRVLADRRAGLV